MLSRSTEDRKVASGAVTRSVSAGGMQGWGVGEGRQIVGEPGAKGKVGAGRLTPSSPDQEP